MKKFNFSLDGVLNYKHQILESVKTDYNKALLMLNNQEHKVQNLIKEYSIQNNSYNSQKEIGINPMQAMSYINYLQQLEKNIQKETLLLNEFKEAEKNKRKELVQAKQETSSIEKLKEKQREEYDKQVVKIEEIFIEELISSKHFRNNK